MESDFAPVLGEVGKSEKFISSWIKLCFLVVTATVLLFLSLLVLHWNRAVGVYRTM